MVDPNFDDFLTLRVLHWWLNCSTHCFNGAWNSDLTRPHPTWWFSNENILISGKPRLVIFPVNFQRPFCPVHPAPQGNLQWCFGYPAIEGQTPMFFVLRARDFGTSYIPVMRWSDGTPLFIAAMNETAFYGSGPPQPQLLRGVSKPMINHGS